MAAALEPAAIGPGGRRNDLLPQLNAGDKIPDSRTRPTGLCRDASAVVGGTGNAALLSLGGS